MKFEPFDPATAQPDGRRPTKLKLFDATNGEVWRGHLLGDALGTSVTVLAYGNETVGEGPKLHVHPYDEVFIVIAGRGRFYVGDEIIDAEIGDVVLGPKGIPHRFENLGPGRLQTLDLHIGPRWYQHNLG